MRKNTDARARGGAARSSEESLVMREERRGSVVRSSKVANPQTGMSARTSTKPYVIAKRAVWEAYQQVKANRGAAGVDEETLFRCSSRACRRICTSYGTGCRRVRISPPPVKQVEIPKAKGGTKKAGHPYCVGSDSHIKSRPQHPGGVSRPKGLDVEFRRIQSSAPSYVLTAFEGLGDGRSGTRCGTAFRRDITRGNSGPLEAPSREMRSLLVARDREKFPAIADFDAFDDIDARHCWVMPPSDYDGIHRSVQTA